MGPESHWANSGGGRTAGVKSWFFWIHEQALSLLLPFSGIRLRLLSQSPLLLLNSNQSSKYPTSHQTPLPKAPKDDSFKKSYPLLVRLMTILLAPQFYPSIVLCSQRLWYPRLQVVRARAHGAKEAKTVRRFMAFFWKKSCNEHDSWILFKSWMIIIQISN